MNILQLLAPSKETEMRKHVLLFTTTATILACGIVAASAQTPGAQTNTQQSPVTHPTQDIHVFQPLEDEDNQDDIYVVGPGVMNGGMMGQGWHHGWNRGRAMMGPVMARIIFSLMDADGDGTGMAGGPRAKPWIPTTMAPLPLRKCRPSCAGEAGNS